MIAFPVTKYGLIFRMVEESDAAFILELRTDPVLSKYLSHTIDNLDRQILWIKNYKLREAAGNEYYFLIENLASEKLGVLRLYDFLDDSYTSGSWLIKRDCDDFVAAKADLFVTSFAFEVLKFKKCLFDVRKANKKVVRYHKLFSTIVSEDNLNLYFMVNEFGYNQKKEYLSRLIK